MTISTTLRRMGIVSALCLLAGMATAQADFWPRYMNGRYSYATDIPLGFGALVEADSGDGGVSTSPSGDAELRVWGTYLLDDSFRTEIDERIAGDISGGWTITYEKRGDTAASWSGSRGERVLYIRAIMGCNESAAYLRLEYDRSALSDYDSIVSRLVKSFRSNC